MQNPTPHILNHISPPQYCTNVHVHFYLGYFNSILIKRKHVLHQFYSIHVVAFQSSDREQIGSRSLHIFFLLNYLHPPIFRFSFFYIPSLGSVLLQSGVSIMIESMFFYGKTKTFTKIKKLYR